LATELLALAGVDVLYGESHCLRAVSWNVQAGRLLALLGRNGAGKSTTIHAIVGFLPVRAGSIRLAGADIANASPESISHAGVALVPQGRRIFRSLTVSENLRVAAHSVAPEGRRRWTLANVYDVFPRLRDRQKQVAANLSGGEQQMLAIGRALMTSPRLLLLDEPSEGLAPQVVHDLQTVLESLKRQVSIVLVEQNLALALALADDVVLLDTGRRIFAGTRDEFLACQSSLQAHLGVA
jgi:branched-chain amino acid transport system ATP-binding protein